jgi:hypothetical protein
MPVSVSAVRRAVIVFVVRRGGVHIAMEVRALLSVRVRMAVIVAMHMRVGMRVDQVAVSVLVAVRVAVLVTVAVLMRRLSFGRTRMRLGRMFVSHGGSSGGRS